MKKQASFILLLCILLFAANNQKLSYPPYFPEPVYDFSKNPLRGEIIDLGRVLFFDPILSKDNTISCASCHSPYSAFAHTDHARSHGIHDSIGARNAPALFNLAWNRDFMWDGAIHHLDMQPLGPMLQAGEMGETLDHILDKLNRSALYRVLFFNAYQDSIATTERMLKALAQFQLTLVSAGSKYDHVRSGRASFSEQEEKGYLLYKKHCAACHSEPLFTNGGFASNGLPVDTLINDYGKWKTSRLSSDSLLFKIPSLRNISYTYPYMHDGRFKRLSEVLNHYSSGIKLSAGLTEGPLTINANEKVELIAFLLTLNDSTFVFRSENQFPEILRKECTRRESNP